MKPLRQLLDDPQLRRSLRVDLEHFSRAMPAFDVEAGATALAHTVAALDSSPPSAANDPNAALGVAKSALPFAIKSTLAVVGCAVIGITGYQLSSAHTRESAPIERHVAPVVSAPAVVAQPKPPVSAAVAAVPEAQPEPPVRTRDSRSRREIAQLVRIRELLAADDPAGAYDLARSSQQEFPSGALREEREGLSIVALFGLGDDAGARARTARFIARYPQSPMRERLQRLAAQ